MFGYFLFLSRKVIVHYYTFVTCYLKDTSIKKNTMYNKDICKDANDEACVKARLAIQDALDMVGGKWKLILISILTDGKRRFRELSREAGISPRVLSKELQDLQMNGLVTRKVIDSKPVSVEYALTPYCETLSEVIDALHRWGTQHREKVIQGKVYQDTEQMV